VRLRVTIAATAAVGGAVATYLTIVHYAHVSPICTTGGCAKVQHSSYAELAGVPVALLGVFAYLALIGTAAVRGLTAAFIGALISLAGVAFSGYLLWAQLGPIGAICQWCLGNDVVAVVVAVLCVARMLTEPGGTPEPGSETEPGRA
jgi:uncharacterized membrane protein